MKRLSLLLLLVLFSCTKDPVMYDITISATEGGTVSPQSGSFEEGSSVTLTATPNAEYEFTKWSNGSTQNPLVLTVTSDLTIQATFTKKQYELTISKEGEGTVNEKVINSGKGYDSGTKIELTAVPAGEWVFAGWSGDVTSTDNPLQVTISSPKNIKAKFVKRKYPLTINIEGQGTVTEEIVNTGRTTEYDSGTTVRLTAQASEGWEFFEWSGVINSKDLSVQLSIDAAKTVNAVFLRTTYKISITGNVSPFLENIEIDLSLNLNQYQNPIWTPTIFWYDSRELSQINQWSAGTSFLTKDFNNDGFTDLFVSFMSSEEEKVPFKLYLYDNSSKSFLDKSTLIKNNVGQSFNRKSMSADINGDGILDFISVSHPEKNNLEFSYFDLTLSYQNEWEQRNIETRSRFDNNEKSGYYHGFAIGDIDNDNDIDIVMGMWHNSIEGITSYLNDGSGNLTTKKAIILQDGNDISEHLSFTQELIDFNNDGCLDLIYWGDSNVRMKYGNCDGTFGPNFESIQINFAWDYKAWDIDRDGFKDLIIYKNGGPQEKEFYVYKNTVINGKSNFELKNRYSVPLFNGSYFELKDLNKDGKIDIVPQGPFFGYDDFNLIDGYTNPYYSITPTLFSGSEFEFSIRNYPIITSVEKINYDNDSKTLSWVTSLTASHDNPTEAYDIYNTRGTINKWHIYYSDLPFTFINENNVKKLSIEQSNMNVSTNLNWESTFKFDISEILTDKLYLRIGHLDSNGVEGNLSYMVLLEKEN